MALYLMRRIRRALCSASARRQLVFCVLVVILAGINFSSEQRSDLLQTKNHYQSSMAVSSNVAEVAVERVGSKEGGELEAVVPPISNESEQAEHGELSNKKVQNISYVDYSKGRPFSRNCLRDTKPHPVPHRESPITVLGPDSDRESPISINPKPGSGLGSIKTIRDHLRIKLQHLDESSALEKMRLLTFEKKCVRNLTPRKFHWIWVGSELPKKYVSNIEQMAVMNPGWEVFLWLEYESKVLFDRLEKNRVQYNFKNVTRYIQEGLFINGDIITREANMAGKSDYLRLEVVYLEGGIYHDTDVSRSPARNPRHQPPPRQQQPPHPVKNATNDEESLATTSLQEAPGPEEK
jgi:hypothetical protein